MKGITGKLWVGLMVLVMFVLSLLWFYQILFLENYYVDYKISNIIKQGRGNFDGLTDLNDPQLEERLDRFVHDYNCHVEVLNLNRVPIYQSNFGKSFPMTGQSARREIIQAAMQGNTFTTTLTHPRFESQFILIGLPIYNNEQLTGVMLIHLPLVPIGDTVDILKQQFTYISIALLITASIIAYFLAKTLIRPLAGITKNAKKMAEGNFSEPVPGQSRSDEIGQLSFTMNYLRSELQKTENLRREFIANVSHELKTPLSLIRGYAETIRDVSLRNDTKRTEHANIIVEESERLSNIVKDILLLSQMRSKNKDLNKTVFSISSLIDNTITKFSLPAEKRNISFEWNHHKEIFVYADEDCIEQVLINLIENALSHSSEHQEITISLTQAKETTTVKIHDHGRGIPAEDLPFIWDRYYSGDRSEQETSQGTGLGLAIVKEILDAHDVNFGVKSSENEGTCFWFNLGRKEM